MSRLRAVASSLLASALFLSSVSASAFIGNAPTTATFASPQDLFSALASPLCEDGFVLPIEILALALFVPSVYAAVVIAGTPTASMPTSPSDPLSTLTSASPDSNSMLPTELPSGSGPQNPTLDVIHDATNTRSPRIIRPFRNIQQAFR